MRILFLATWFPYPPDNGSKLRVYYLLRGLAQRHELTLVSFAFSTAQPHIPSELNRWCQRIETIPVDPFAFNQAGTLHTFLSPRPVASRAIPAMTRLSAHILQTTAFDVIIASTGMMIDYALQAPSGTTLVLEEHNAMTRWAQERYDQAQTIAQRARAWMSWQKSKAYEARVYHKFDLITMVSEADRQAAKELVANSQPPVEVIPNGVDCTHNRPGLAAHATCTLVFNGSLAYSANYSAMQWFLSQVWPRIRAQAPDAELLITGSTAGVQLNDLALDDHVQLFGYVDDIRIPVSKATIAIAPILQGGGTRLKILEAMALGTPVVSTFKGAEGLNVVSGEHLLLADDPERFAQAVHSLLRNPQARQRLADNARRLVETDYDWQQIGQHFVTVIEESIQRKTSKQHV